MADTVLVTGSSRGIGRAIALRAARDGFDVVVHCRSRVDEANAVMTQITARQELVADNGLAVFVCQIFLGDEVVATAQLNAFQPPNVDEYLRGLNHG